MSQGGNRAEVAMSDYWSTGEKLPGQLVIGSGGLAPGWRGAGPRRVGLRLTRICRLLSSRAVQSSAVCKEREIWSDRECCGWAHGPVRLRPSITPFKVVRSPADHNV